jgi:hypothetical protein
VQVLHRDRLDRSVVAGRADWHDLYKDELCLRIGVEVGERIVRGTTGNPARSSGPATDRVCQGD